MHAHRFTFVSEYLEFYYTKIMLNNQYPLHWHCMWPCMTIIFQTAEYGAQAFLTKSITTSLSCNASPLQIPPPCPPPPQHLAELWFFDSPPTPTNKELTGWLYICQVFRARAIKHVYSWLLNEYQTKKAGSYFPKNEDYGMAGNVLSRVITRPEKKFLLSSILFKSRSNWR